MAVLRGWSSTEQFTAGGAVRFEQRARPPAPVVDSSTDGARELAERYWQEIEAFTCKVVQARKRGDGLELRLLGHWPLLAFGRPEMLVDSSQALSRFPIVGGALARVPGGSITFVQTLAPVLELRTTVDGFVPRFGSGALSWEIQRRLHVAISRRYLARLVDQASG